jgi:hypothetical protein
VLIEDDIPGEMIARAWSEDYQSRDPSQIEMASHCAMCFFWDIAKGIISVICMRSRGSGVGFYLKASKEGHV